MSNRSERYRADLERLIDTGRKLAIGLQIEHAPAEAKKAGMENQQALDARKHYQAWYSEALACVTQLLPGRVDDFVAYYKPAGARKILSAGNYTLSDYLQGKTIYFSDTLEWQVSVGSALMAMFQQYNIVEALARTFESTLFDIRTLVHADLLDDELGAAEELNKKGFQRGAGAVAGVVLEAHLSTICDTHKKKPAKNATISTLNDLLKKDEVIDTPTWRFIQHLGDLRNKCDHKTDEDPTKDQVKELIEGVRKITKTVF
jgi:hypothetical protein